jgi:hypothetical protein
MGVAGSPKRRSTDRHGPSRWRVWWGVNGIQVIVFALLGVIVAGEASDLYNDRQQATRDEVQSCVLGNLAETNSESLRRLRIQAPVIEAAGKLITAMTPDERDAAEATMRRALAERVDHMDDVDPTRLPTVDDCD